MNIYVDKINIYRLFHLIFFKRKSKQNYQKILYIDASKLSQVLIKILRIFGVNNFSVLSFKMMNIKDGKQLIRARIFNEDLFNFQKAILKHPSYEKNINNLKLSNEIINYINAGLVEGTIEEESVARTLFVIEVVHWFMNLNGETGGVLFMQKRSWKSIYEDIAKRYGIETIFYKEFSFKMLSKNLYKNLRSNHKFFLFGRFVKFFEFLNFISFYKEKNEINMLVFGRGDINLKNNGYNSDFFWSLNSNFPLESISYQSINSLEKEQLDRAGILSFSNSPSIADILNSRKILKFDNNLHSKDENKELKRVFNDYNSTYNFWKSVFKKNKTKLYLTWYKYNKEYIAASHALKSLGGITAIWQISFDGFKNIENRIHTDLSFCWSNFSVDIEEELQNTFAQNIIIGYPKDYSFKLLKDDASKIRKSLALNGAKNIICVFDENSGDDSRWHTGHALQQENYSCILEELLRNPDLGVIFKPKTYNSLHNRLGDVNQLISAAEETGRLHIFKNSGRYTNLEPPVLGALASDICIHGHLGAGSAAVESMLAGIPTLLIDREGYTNSKLNELELGKVRFKSWPDIIDAFNEYFSNKKLHDGFGDWSRIKKELDPFNDGLGAYRMGEYLNCLLSDIKKGACREEAMISASKSYSDKWGKDKVIINIK